MQERQGFLGNMTCFEQRSCLPRRLSCLQLKARNSWFKFCLMSWLKTDCFICRVPGITQLVVTGEDSCPLDVRNEERNTQYNLEIHQEEADIIIVQQVLHCVWEARQIAVVSDDTDVFVLLLYHYQMVGVEVPLTMESPSKERAILDIKVTQAKHRDIVNLLPAHAISGCDTTACYWKMDMTYQL